MTDPNIIPVDRTFQHVSGIAFAIILYLLNMGILLGIRWVLRRVFRGIARRLPADTPRGDIFLFGIDKRIALFVLFFCAAVVLPLLVDIGFSGGTEHCAPQTHAALLWDFAFLLALPLCLFLMCRSAYLSLRYPYPLRLSKTDRIYHAASKIFYLAFLYATFGLLRSMAQSSWPCP